MEGLFFPFVPFLSVALIPSPQPSLFDALLEVAPMLEPGQACVTIEGGLENIFDLSEEVVSPGERTPVFITIQPDPYDDVEGPFNNRSLNILMFAIDVDEAEVPIPIILQVFIFGVENPFPHRLMIDSRVNRPADDASVAVTINRSPAGLEPLEGGALDQKTEGEAYFWVTESDSDESYRVVFQFRAENRAGDEIMVTEAAAAVLTPVRNDRPTSTPPSPGTYALIGDCESTLLAQMMATDTLNP